MPTFRYFLIQYVPDAVRDERINLGVVVVGTDGPYFGARLLAPKHRGRLKRMGFASDFAFLDDLTREFRESAVADLQLATNGRRPWDAKALEQAGSSWANTVQLTAPRAAIHERPEMLLELLFTELVSDPAEPRTRARDRRWIRSRALRGLRRGLTGSRPDFDFDAHVRRNIRVDGAVESHKFDIQLVNGQPLQLIQALAVESAHARDREIEALAWMIDDVRKQDSTTAVSVLSVGDAPALDRAERIYDGLGAQLVREPDFDPWIDSAATGLLVAVGN